MKILKYDEFLYESISQKEINNLKKGDIVYIKNKKFPYIKAEFLRYDKNKKSIVVSTKGNEELEKQRWQKDIDNNIHELSLFTKFISLENEYNSENKIKKGHFINLYKQENFNKCLKNLI